MVAILRVQSKWTGFSGAPGFSVFHFRDFGTGDGPGGEPDSAQAQSAAQRVGTFWGAIKSVIPGQITIETESTVDMLEDTTGQLIDSFSVTPNTVTGTTANAPYSAASGAVVNWTTGSVRNGRRIRGRTFVVPVWAGIYTAGGVINPTYLTTMQTAAEALVDRTGTPDLGVYARPTAPGIPDGQWVVATGARVPNMAAILTSRRD